MLLARLRAHFLEQAPVLLADAVDLFADLGLLRPLFDLIGDVVVVVVVVVVFVRRIVDVLVIVAAVGLLGLILVVAVVDTHMARVVVLQRSNKQKKSYTVVRRKLIANKTRLRESTM